MHLVRIYSFIPRAKLKQSFGIAHTTLEVECAAHACVGAPVLGR